MLGLRLDTPKRQGQRKRCGPSSPEQDALFSAKVSQWAALLANIGVNSGQFRRYIHNGAICLPQKERPNPQRRAKREQALPNPTAPAQPAENREEPAGPRLLARCTWALASLQRRRQCCVRCSEEQGQEAVLCFFSTRRTARGSTLATTAMGRRRAGFLGVQDEGEQPLGPMICQAAQDKDFVQVLLRLVGRASRIWSPTWKWVLCPLSPLMLLRLVCPIVFCFFLNLLL